MALKISIKKWSISDWSSFFSLLCAVDCIVLPLLITLVSVIGIASSNFDGLHKISHLAALYIMLPLGTLAVCSNFCAHRMVRLLLLGFAGLALVYVTHAGEHDEHHNHPHLRHEGEMNLYDYAAHFVEKYHTLLSVAGSLLLLLSNYLSHKVTHSKENCTCASQASVGKADNRTNRNETELTSSQKKEN